MHRVVFIMFFMTVLLWGCTGRGVDLPSATPANEGYATDQGYPVAQAPNAVENTSDGLAYPAQEGESPSPGIDYPAPEIIDLVEKLSSEVPTPQPGAGSIYGVLFSVTNQATIPNTMVYLVESADDDSETLPSIIVGPSPEDIILYSDQDGAIIQDDIPPGKYFVIMSAPPYDWAEGYSDADAENLLLIHVRENEKTNMGIIYIFWP